MKPYVYILVRSDMPVCDQIVQASHAALEAGFSFESPAETCSIVLVTVRNEEELKSWSERLTYNDIKHQIFFEPDFDEPGYTALATEPVYDKQRSLFKRLKLWRQ